MTQTLDESVTRLREWAAGTGKPTPGRFDARDREALRVVLDALTATPSLSAWERTDLEALIQNEHALYADAWAKYEDACARIAWLERQLERAQNG